MSINDRFTLFADHVSEFVGQWWFTAISFVLLLAWIGYGAFIVRSVTHDWFTSTTWNFPLNTFTTVGEWFLEGFILAAANRVEKRNRDLQELHEQTLEKLTLLVGREEQELADIDTRLKKDARG